MRSGLLTFVVLAVLAAGVAGVAKNRPSSEGPAVIAGGFDGFWMKIKGNKIIDVYGYN